MRDSRIVSDVFVEQPYWWDAAPPCHQPVRGEPPRHSDVAIIGGGITGLVAAITLLRAGRSVTVFDAEQPGYGAARRNAGTIGRTLKTSFSEFCGKIGRDHALRIYRELNEAMHNTIDFITDNGIACHLERRGRLVVATNRYAFDAMVAEYRTMKAELGFNFWPRTGSQLQDEIASDTYYGGVVIPDLAALHPGLYHQGLLGLTTGTGGSIAPGTLVKGVRQHGAAAVLSTSRGEFTARDVLLCTNGYVSPAFGWHARRLIPFNGYIAATEELPEALLSSLLPQKRPMMDSNIDLHYFRLAPDRPRLLFGGLTGCRTDSASSLINPFHRILTRTFPQLAGTRLTHLWSGRCAATFDFLPHVGRHDGLWYAHGYNFAGITMGTHLGQKIAYRILGDSKGSSWFSEIEFPASRFYSGNPWFARLAVRYLDLKQKASGFYRYHKHGRR